MALDPTVPIELLPFQVSMVGDIVDQGGLVGTLNTIDVLFDTNIVWAVNPALYVQSFDGCFFNDNPTPCADPVWTLVAGELPFGVRLSPVSGVYTISSSILLIRGNGPNQFTVAMTDSCGNVITETYYTIPNPTPVPEPPPGGGPPPGCWTPGDLWSITTQCAYQGTWGLQRTADGITGSSDVVSSQVLDTSAGQTYYLSFWAKGSGSANGTITLGFSFYDINDALISFLGVSTTGSPTSWTQFLGTVTAPANAVTAVPTIRATGHLVGTWCVDLVYAILTGGHFVISAIKHYSTDFTAYR